MTYLKVLYVNPIFMSTLFISFIKFNLKLGWTYCECQHVNEENIKLGWIYCECQHVNGEKHTS